MEESGNRVPFALFDDLRLDLCHGPTVRNIVSDISRLCITGLTHVISWFIASHTDWLRSPSFFPFIPRSRALQMSAQLSPSSTYSCSFAIESWIRVSLKPIFTE
jgi:hypothetical protein